jgi:uncharacterized protein (TIGR02444 family)
MTASDTDALTGSSPFWRFSLGFYRQPGVAPACITLQDEGGVDVNVLLYLLWNASLGRRLTVEDVARVERESAAWREAVVKPLRSVRRALRDPPPLVEPQVAEVYRTRIKAVELESERLQQEALFAMTGSLNLAERAAEPMAAARANCDAYLAIHGRPIPIQALEAILAAFAAGDVGGSNAN